MSQDSENVTRRSKAHDQTRGQPLLAATLVALSTVVLSLVFPYSRELELKSQDLRAAVRGTREVAAPIVIVAIDDLSFEKINIRWPWPRQLVAAAVDTAARWGAQVIGIDIMLGDAGYNAEEDAALVQAVAAAGNVVLPAKFDTRRQGNLRIDYYDVPLPAYAGAAKAIGFVNLPTDPDGLVRRVVPADSIAGNEHRAFAVELLRAYGADVELPSAGSIIVDWAAPGAFTVVPFYQVLEGTAAPELFRDAIVLMGAFFKESQDLFLTPVEPVTGLYGVEIHANIVNTLRRGELLRETGLSTDLVVLVLLAVAASLLMVRLKPTVGLCATLLGMALYAVVAYVSYAARSTIVDLFTPLLALALVWFGSVLYRYLVVDRQRRKVRTTFARYVSKEVVDSILDSGSEIELGGEMREVVVLFSDICGFTPLSESMSPPEVVEMLNGYLTEMTDVIFRYKGTVNKYIGDAIMAFYGAPVAIPDAAEAAVRSCLEMRAALADFNRRRADAGKRGISIGMGLHKGFVLVGNVGSPRQMEYTAIGDVVNVGSRIEGLTRDFAVDLLISDEVYRDVSGLVTVRSFPPVAVKGRNEKIVVHAVTGMKELPVA